MLLSLRVFVCFFLHFVFFACLQPDRHQFLICMSAGYTSWELPPRLDVLCCQASGFSFKSNPLPFSSVVK